MNKENIELSRKYNNFYSLLHKAYPPFLPELNHEIHKAFGELCVEMANTNKRGNVVNCVACFAFIGALNNMDHYCRVTGTRYNVLPTALLMLLKYLESIGQQ